MSEGASLGSGQSVTLSEPSRAVRVEKAEGRRSIVEDIVFRDSLGNPLNTQPFTGPGSAFYSLTPIHSVTFSNNLKPGAAGQGAYTPRWEFVLSGFPLGVDPVPVEGYSATSTEGAGDRPYPEPFTSLAIENLADAQASADALTEIGTRIGNILNFKVRLMPGKIPDPNALISITDAKSGLTGRPGS